MIADEEAQRILAALARLPGKYRKVLLLRCQKGRSFEEIGRRLGQAHGERGAKVVDADPGTPPHRVGGSAVSVSRTLPRKTASPRCWPPGTTIWPATPPQPGRRPPTCRRTCSRAWNATWPVSSCCAASCVRTFPPTSRPAAAWAASRSDGMLQQIGIAIVGEAGGQLGEDAAVPLDFGQQQGTAVGGNRAAIEGGLEGQRGGGLEGEGVGGSSTARDALILRRARGVSPRMKRTESGG